MPDYRYYRRIVVMEAEGYFLEVLIVLVTAVSVLLPTDAQDACSGGYIRDSYCYKIIPQSRPRSVAVDMCERMGGRLPVLPNKEADSALGRLMQERGVTTIWLGATRVRGDWTWVSDDSVISSQGCYKDYGGNRDLPHSVYIPNLVPDLCIQACRDAGYSYAGTQAQAECYCGDTYGKYNLTSGDQTCTTACTGDNSIFCGGWARNSIYHVEGTFAVWGYKQPDNLEGDEMCAFMEAGEFYDESCHVAGKYICQLPVSSCVANDPNYLQLPNTCIHYVDSTATWFEARSDCLSRDGDLLSFAGSSIFDNVTANIPPSDSEGYWIGLSNVQWTWDSNISDTKQFSRYSNWSNMEPNGYFDDCLALSSSNYVWEDVPCSTGLNFICQIELQDTTTSEMTTTTSNIDTTTSEIETTTSNMDTTTTNIKTTTSEIETTTRSNIETSTTTSDPETTSTTPTSNLETTVAIMTSSPSTLAATTVTLAPTSTAADDTTGASVATDAVTTEPPSDAATMSVSLTTMHGVQTATNDYDDSNETETTHLTTTANTTHDEDVLNQTTTTTAPDVNVNDTLNFTDIMDAITNAPNGTTEPGGTSQSSTKGKTSVKFVTESTSRSRDVDYEYDTTMDAATMISVGLGTAAAAARDDDDDDNGLSMFEIALIVLICILIIVILIATAAYMHYKKTTGVGRINPDAEYGAGAGGGAAGGAAGAGAGGTSRGSRANSAASSNRRGRSSGSLATLNGVTSTGLGEPDKPATPNGLTETDHSEGIVLRNPDAILKPENGYANGSYNTSVT